MIQLFLSIFFQKHSQFGEQAKKVIGSLTLDKDQGITSIITATELLSFKISSNEIELLRNRYLEIPNLKTIEINQTIAIEAARIRRVYGYRLPDAIQLATCLYAKADKFITNDVRLKNFPEVTIEIIK